MTEPTLRVTRTAADRVLRPAWEKRRRSCHSAFQEAAEAAFQIKDVEALNEVRAKAGNPRVAAQVDTYIAQLSARR